MDLVPLLPLVVLSHGHTLALVFSKTALTSLKHRHSYNHTLSSQLIPSAVLAHFSNPADPHSIFLTTFSPLTPPQFTAWPGSHALMLYEAPCQLVMSLLHACVWKTSILVKSNSLLAPCLPPCS